MENQKNNQQLLEEAKQAFLTEWDECEQQDSKPSLTDFIRRYPSIAPQLLAWATTITARHAAVAQDTEVPEASERTLAIINGVKGAVLAEPRNLDDAREALGLSQPKFAKRLRLGPTVTKGLGRGLGRSWPSVLEEMLEGLLARPRQQVVALLNGPRFAADNYKSSGDPAQQTFPHKTFRELIEDSARKGEMSPEDKQFWIEQLEAEGK